MRATGKGLRWFLRSGLRWTILALLVVAFLWFVPQFQGEYFSRKVPAEERPALVNEYRRTWAQIIGGFGLLLGLYFTWRRVEISQEQQVTERFTRAIDQLGATDSAGERQLETRLGGIYALERIARDSEKDRGPIAEILTAYVRHHAPRKGGEKTPTEQPARKSEAEEAAQDISPAPDVQAVLTVLVRLSKLELLTEPIDLSNTDLRHANLSGLRLERAILTDADLRAAVLSHTHFESSYFGGALLDDAALVEADLSHTLFDETSLQDTLLYGADLSEAEMLTQDQIDKAHGAKRGEFATQLPADIYYPQHWPDTWPSP
jgi:Pentapeptide repeats (8 copies)